MYPKSLERVIRLFSKFPGIGPRQANRFAFFLLKEAELAKELGIALTDFEGKVEFCGTCFRTIERGESRCDFCRDPKRDKTAIAVVEKEPDLQNLEKTRAYRGLYHVLGGTVSPLNPDPPRALRLRELEERVKSALDAHKRCEVILAMNPTTEGNTTALYIERVLSPLKIEFAGLTITRLARGLSLGSELEYADESTIAHALKNRK